jgi:hypothetical protein
MNFLFIFLIKLIFLYVTYTCGTKKPLRGGNKYSLKGNKYLLRWNKYSLSGERDFRLVIRALE